MHAATTMIATVLTLSLGLGFTAAHSEEMSQPAAQPGTPSASNPALSSSGPSQAASEAAKPAWFGELYATDLVGKDVVDGSGDEIADIEDIVSRSGGGELFAVVSTGGFLGIGDKEIAVPLDKLSRQPSSDEITLAEMSEQEMKAMAEYNDVEYQPVSRYQKLGFIASERN